MVNVKIKKKNQNGEVPLKIGQAVRGIVTLDRTLLMCDLNGSPLAVAEMDGVPLKNSYGVVFDQDEETFTVHLVMPERVAPVKYDWSSRWECKQEVIA